MKDQFLFFTCIPENKELLKEEIKLFYPELHLSFSNKNFLTFKNKGKLFTSEEIQQLEFAFALNFGESPSPLDPEFVEREIVKTTFELDEPETPSRAYYKIKQACECFGIQSDKNINWLDIGSAPGGSSYYLLKQFGNVIGIDSAKMADKCMENSRFHFLNKPIQIVSAKDFRNTEIHYIACDLNLDPRQAIPFILKLAAELSKLEGILFTCKMVNVGLLKEIKELKTLFKKNGWSQISIKQLPAHHREFLIAAFT